MIKFASFHWKGGEIMSGCNCTKREKSRPADEAGKTHAGVGNIRSHFNPADLPFPKHIMARDLRVLDRLGDFIKAVPHEEADSMIAAGFAQLEGTGRRAYLRLKSRLTKRDFCSFEQVNGRKHYTYAETILGDRMTVLKRLCPDGHFRNWDNNLSFDELRAGRTQHRRERGELIEMATPTLVEAVA